MASLQPLEFLVVPPKATHTATVIFLHGLGDSGAGWLPFARMMQQDPGLAHVKWVLPHAPKMHVTMHGGVEMPAWYDIASRDTLLGDERFGRHAHEDGARILAFATRPIAELITSEINASPNVPTSRIVLGGFSQGGAMALFTGLTTERKLAGLFGLSSYLPFLYNVWPEMSEHAPELPIFMGHGTADQLVRFQFGKVTSNSLKDWLPQVEPGQISGPGVRFEQYGALVHPKELEDLSAWLKAVVSPEE